MIQLTTQMILKHLKILKKLFHLKFHKRSIHWKNTVEIIQKIILIQLLSTQVKSVKIQLEEHHIVHSGNNLNLTADPINTTQFATKNDLKSNYI